MELTTLEMEHFLKFIYFFININNQVIMLSKQYYRNALRSRKESRHNENI